MNTENYRKWMPALIIGLVLCLPVIAWLFGGTSGRRYPAAGPPGAVSESPHTDE